MSYGKRHVGAMDDIHPLDNPLGNNHHTDVDFEAEDIELGHLLARSLGSLQDLYGNPESLWEWYYRRSTYADEWARVARALRIHGLKIVDSDDER